MKKFTSLCAAGLMALIFWLIPLSPDAKAAAIPAKASFEKSAPLSLTCIELEERERWILDEVLSDYVSEEVVRLMDSDIGYEIGDWVDRDTYTYLFFEKHLPEGTVYTACGYALTGNGNYVYFELSSPAALTRQQVDEKAAGLLKQFQEGFDVLLFCGPACGKANDRVAGVQVLPKA